MNGNFEVGHRIHVYGFLSEGQELLKDVYWGNAPVETNPFSVGRVGGPRIIIDSTQPTLVRYEGIPSNLEENLQKYLQKLKEAKPLD